MGDFEVGRTLDDRYPVGDEEYIRWLRTTEARDFLVDIIREQRPSRRHTLLVTREEDREEVELEGWIQRLAKRDFLRFENPGHWVETEFAVRDIMASAGGPPPSIVNGAGGAWCVLDGSEKWYLSGYGVDYQQYALIPEAILQFMQIKFGISYERAEDEFLRNRYTPEEQEFYDQELRDQPPIAA